jgi:hypothetical protein
LFMILFREKRQAAWELKGLMDCSFDSRIFRSSSKS